MKVKEWWDAHKENILLGILVLYVISLAVVTIDTVFGPWLFPPKLDKQIAQQIDKLKSPDPNEQNQAIEDLVNDKGDFAVPQLIKLLKKKSVPEQAKINAMTALSKITEQNLGNDPQAWISWYEKNKHMFP